jgi:protein involved in polysaccharide export with SLBB domain
MVIVFTLVSCGIAYGQEPSMIEQEIEKLESEYQNPTTEEKTITPSDIIEEVTKPGNEGLLEQLKKLGSDNQDMDIIDQIKNEEPDQEADDENEETEEEKKQKILSSSEELMFESRREYYESIKEFYGYNVFLNNIPYYEKTELPINGKYTIGPGDELSLVVWGEASLQYKLGVSREGTCFIPDIGVITVHGLTVPELEIKLKKLLAKKYSTIDPPDGKPTTFFDVSFDKMRTVSVFINGEVVNPGAYTLDPRATILTAIIKANGITAKGTLREIKLIRDGSVIRELDLYDYLQTGKSVNDITLKENDNIFIGPRINTISLTGETLNPLKYELKKNETLSDLIKFSGGIIASASIDRVSIQRIIPFEERTSPVVFYKQLDMDFVEIINGEIIVKPIELYDQDVIELHQIPKILRNYVVVNGAVYRKGRYEFTEGMTLSDLLSKAGGLLSDAYLDRAEMIRIEMNYRTEYTSINLKKQKYLDMRLNHLDSINIFSKHDLISKNVVIISGEIRKPGFYYLNDSMRVSDLIFTRGGLVDKWTRDRTYLLRADLTRFLENSDETRIIPINIKKILEGDVAEDVYLKDGDQLHIYNSAVAGNKGKVQISGYVNLEGEYDLSEGMTVEELILKAYGFKEDAYKDAVTVFRRAVDGPESDQIASSIEVQLSRDVFETGDFKKSKFLLKPSDYVVVRRNPFSFDLRQVYLTGEVKFPGVYSLINKGEKL